MKISINKPFFIVIAIMALVICVLFYDVIFMGKVFGTPDTLSPESATIVLDKIYSATGEYPLWQPWIFSGMPTVEAFTHISNLYFPSLILNLLFLKGILAQLLHLLFAGLGGYILLRNFGVSSFSAFLSGASFMLTPFMITMIVFGHGSQMMTAAYLPWVILLTIKVIKKPSLMNTGLLAILLGFQLQRAHVQIAYYSWMLVGAYVLISLIWHFTSRQKENRIWTGYASFLLAAGLGIGIALLIYLPSMEYTPFSVRGGTAAGGADYRYATGWSLHPKEMLTFILPSAFGFGGQAYWGWMPFTDYPNYLGIVLIFLACFGFWSKRKEMIGWFLMITSLFAVFISFGSHFSFIYNLFFNYFPFFNKFRVPAMILILLQFNFAILAAFGLEAMLELKEKAVPRWFWILAGLLGSLLLILAFGESAIESVLRSNFTPPRTGDPNAIRVINELRLNLWIKDAWMLIVWCALGLGTVWMWIQRKVSQSIFLTVMVLITLLDIAKVDQLIIQPEKNSGRSLATISGSELKRYFTADPVIQFLQKDKSDYRIYPAGQWFGESRFRAFGIESVGGYHPAKLNITNDFIEKTRNISSIPLMQMLNVKYLLSPREIPFPQFVEEFKGDMRTGAGVQKTWVYSLNNALPRAWFVKQVEANKEDQLWRMINEANFDPANIAYIQTENEHFAGSYVAGSVVEIKRSIHEMKIEVSCPEDGFLVVSEVHYPLRWQCNIDGKPVETIETNKLIRGVKVPQGNHAVEFMYDKSTFNQSKWISIFSFIFAMGLLCFGLFKNFKKHENL